MANLGTTYGSEKQFLEYRRQASDPLDTAIMNALGLDPERAVLEWRYPGNAGRRGKEVSGLDFMAGDESPASRKAMEAWKTAWPRSGTPPTWDGVARLTARGQEPRWLLFEAKANHPEFTGSPCRASERTRGTIVRTLGKAKSRWLVHRDVDWTGSYYQHANRLAMLTFLEKHGIPAVLVEIFFCGERFPDGRMCPASADEWQPLLEARRLTLGLPATGMGAVATHVFLPALQLGGVVTEHNA
jgi:hypothetical protein